MTNRPPIPDPPHRGGCLCGAVRYALNAGPMGINACHCDDCRKLTGAANLLMVIGPREAFVHEKGEVTRWRKTADSGRQIDIVRCAQCGTRMWHEPLAAPALIYIAAGTLDHPAWAVPTSHMYVGKAAANIHIEPDAVQIPGQPAERQTLMDAFARAYPKSGA
jgi:hypothetical protein